MDQLDGRKGNRFYFLRDEAVARDGLSCIRAKT